MIVDRSPNESFLEMLRRPDIQMMLRNESLKQSKLEPSRLWRLGVITSDNDDVRSPIYPSKFVVIGIQPHPREATFIDIAGPTLLFGKEGASDTLEAAAEAAQDFFYERRSLKTVRGGWLCQHSVRGMVGRDGFLSVPHGISIQSVESWNKYVPFVDFLRGERFPMPSGLPDGPSLFTMEVSGLVASDREGKLGVLQDPYFIRRSLIDDEGHLIYCGLDEGILVQSKYKRLRESNSRWAPFPVNFFPCGGYELYEKYGSHSIEYARHDKFSPLFRYTFFPIATEEYIPLIDTPLTNDRWVDVFIRPDGTAFVYFLKPGSDLRQLGMELKELWDDELSKKEHHLLKFTRDAAHVETYIRMKARILKKAFEVVQVPVFPNHKT
jgi:hypothetical protein